MDKAINIGIPHVGELVFESIDTPGLIKCLEVSQTWKELAENALIKRWKGKMLEACKSGETKVVQVLLERCNSEESGLNKSLIYFQNITIDSPAEDSKFRAVFDTLGENRSS